MKSGIVYRAFLLAAVTSGCYATVPLRTPEPSVGSDVVARLNSNGTARLANLVGPRVERLQGRVIQTTPDTLFLALTATGRDDGDETFWKRERIGAPREFIARIEERRLSTPRTAAVGLLAVAGALLIRSAVAGSNSGPPTGGPPHGQ